MSRSPVKFAVCGGLFTQPMEIPMPRRYCASFVTAAIVPLCLSFLLAACGDDSSSTTSTSGPPAELRDYPYCEVIPDTVSGDTLTEYVFNTLPFGPCPAKKFDHDHGAGHHRRLQRGLRGELDLGHDQRAPPLDDGHAHCDGWRDDIGRHSHRRRHRVRTCRRTPDPGWSADGRQRPVCCQHGASGTRSTYSRRDSKSSS